MLRFLGLRLIHTLPVIVGITLAAFVLIHAVPGDPIRIMLGGKAPQARIDEVEHQLGVDRPLLLNFARAERDSWHQFGRRGRRRVAP